MRGLISCKTVLAFEEQDIEQQNSQPSNQKLKTMVKRCMDQKKIRALNFEARNERIETGTQAKDKGKGKHVSDENAINAKQKDSVQKEMLAVSATNNKRGKSTRSTSPATEPKTKKAMRKILRKESQVSHRINLDPKIQTKYVDTKIQLADILTTGSFTRDEWNHLLLLFNIRSNSLFSNIHLMSASLQNRDLPEIWSLSLPTMPSSSSSQSPVNLRASSTLDSLSTGKLVAMDSNENRTSSSQVWHTDSVPETRCEIEKEHHRSKLDPSQFDQIATQCRICGQNIRKTCDRNLVVRGRQNGSD